MSVTPQHLLALVGAGAPVDRNLSYDIERFLAREARLLDTQQLRQWYDLLDDDLIYWAPLRENRFRRDRAPEISRTHSAFFDETKESIQLRLGRLESGMAWAEDPPTRHVYAVTNVEGFHLEEPDLFEVHSVFTLYRSRSERDDSTLMGRRRDVLRRCNGSFKIKARLVLLQQSTLAAKNLSVFF